MTVYDLKELFENIDEDAVFSVEGSKDFEIVLCVEDGVSYSVDLRKKKTA